MTINQPSIPITAPPPGYFNIGEQKGRQGGGRALLSRQLRRWFGELPAWATTRLQSADAEQLEAWAERIFDAATSTDLLGPEAGG